MKNIEIVIDAETKEYVAFLGSEEIWRDYKEFKADDLELVKVGGGFVVLMKESQNA